jgi:D-amino peptidase
MNLFISADMEGTAGVCSWNQCDPENADEYPVYRRYMTREVRAAIEGAREAGARRVLVNDSHWSMRNLLFDDLPGDDDLRVISGTRKPWSMAQGIDSGVEAAFFTGYHAKAGDAATLAHTFSSEVYAVTINGVACSEALLNAALAGTYGVPVLLVTGDCTIVDECMKTMPWIVGVPVKEAIGYTAVDSLTPAAAQAAIRAGAREAIERKERAKLFTFDAPLEMILETVAVEHSDFIELMPGFTRIGGRATRFRADNFPIVMQAFIVATRMAAAAEPVA